MESGFIDSFRYLYPDKVQYTWWSYMFNARANNVGWRIDYFILSERLASKMKNSIIRDEIYGSDHCPVVLEIFK
jgi:exodeoxyribonuclease-3